MKKILLTIAALLLAIFIMTGMFLNLTSKDVFEIKLPLEMSEGLRAVTAKILFFMGLSGAEVEYSDAHVTMAAGRSVFLPVEDGLEINIQAAIRSVDGETQIIIGIPALPLLSY